MNSFDINGFNDNNNDFNGCGPQTPTTETTSRVNNLNTNLVFTDDEFKMPDRFAKELEVLEKKSLSGDNSNSLTRMSLLRKFDPLVDTIDTNHDFIQRTSNLSINESKSYFESIEQNLSLNEFQNQTNCMTTHNESTTLMNFNSPINVPIVSSRLDQSSQQNDNQNNDQNCDQLLSDFRTKELLFHERLIEKDRRIQRLEENLNTVSNNCQKYEVLLNLVHSFNEEVIEMASEVIDNLMADKNELIDRCNEMSAERSQALEDVNNVEKNFYEVHNRYDKVRTALEESKTREMQFNDQYLELMDKLREKDEMFDLLKTKAEQKIEDANLYIESAQRECQSELIAVKAQLKRSEMKINGLQLQLDQKTKENEELTQMVDELIANVEK